MRYVCALLLIVGCALPVHAQSDDEAGWTFTARFSGSSNSSGTILRADPSLGYSFNRYIQTYAGLPFYFVNQSATSNSMNGIGNAYLGVRGRVDNPAVTYTSNLVVSAPTGDKARGFSTGRMTVDWTNTLSRSFSSVTPFASVGVANTISDTSFFVRPFTSLGLVGHFEGGATVDVGPLFSVGASGYAVRASGEQRIFSKIVENRGGPVNAQGRGRGPGNAQNRGRVFETNTETVGSADIANDHGFSTWLGVSTRSPLNFEIGFSRSSPYDLNTFFFGVGLRVGK